MTNASPTPHAVAELHLPYLRLWRKHLGLTGVQLEERADVNKNTISAAERGRPVTKRTVRKLAAGLGITEAQLLGEKPPKWKGQ